MSCYGKENDVKIIYLLLKEQQLVLYNLTDTLMKVVSVYFAQSVVVMLEIRWRMNANSSWEEHWKMHVPLTRAVITVIQVQVTQLQQLQTQEKSQAMPLQP